MNEPRCRRCWILDRQRTPANARQFHLEPGFALIAHVDTRRTRRRNNRSAGQCGHRRGGHSVLTAIVAGANRDRSDAIDLLQLTSHEVAAAVAAYVIELEDETGVTDHLVTQVAASPGIYQRISGRQWMWLLGAAAKPDRLHRVLDQVTQDISASSLPGRMRWMLRIGQVMAVCVILWMIRAALKASQLPNILTESTIAALAVTFIVSSGFLFRRACHGSFAPVQSLLWGCLSVVHDRRCRRCHRSYGSCGRCGGEVFYCCGHSLGRLQ